MFKYNNGTSIFKDCKYTANISSPIVIIAANKNERPKLLFPCDKYKSCWL
jgi:hypothetical protein